MHELSDSFREGFGDSFRLFAEIILAIVGAITAFASHRSSFTHEGEQLALALNEMPAERATHD